MDEYRPLRIRGAITALVTPFCNGTIDLRALEGLAEWQILNGVDGLAVATVGGEGPTLSPFEREAIIETCVRVAAGRIPVIAATGTNSTESSIALTRRAETLGASAALVTAPYYSKPGQKGIVHHFEQLGAATNLPLIIDNDPGRTASSIGLDALRKLAAIPSITGLRDATGDIAGFAGLPPFIRQRFRFFSGCDATALAFTIAGGNGMISSGANILPRLFTSMQQAASAGNLSAALSLLDRLMPLIRALGPDGDAACIKYALRSLPGMDPALRLPLVPIEQEAGSAIDKALAPFLIAGNKRLSL
jgi:4-hydroxy-tetrahydrodipicolinate synthase